MDKIEQAREALKDVLASLVAAHSLLKRSPKTGAPSNKMFDTMLSDYANSIERGRAYLEAINEKQARALTPDVSLAVLDDMEAELSRSGSASPSTPVDGVRCASCDGTGVDLYDGTAHDCQVCSGRGSTPVDGVGAEPRDDAARIVYEVMSWASGLPGPSGETIPAWDDPAKAIFRDKAREAARKISLVAAEAERLRFEGDLDKWMKIIGAGITGYQPEAYAVMDAACRELVSLRGMNASLVLPDGCCGYTDADGACCSPTLPSEIDVATDVACGVGNTYGGDVLSGGDRAVVELGLRRLVGTGIGLLKRVPETRDEAEARIMQEYRWGNLTSLGVANHLRRAGFRQEIAIDKANALASPEAEARRRERVADGRWENQARQATSVIALIRAMIGEMFGPVIESEEATLLRGPEAKHSGEAILEALQKIEARLAQAERGPSVTVKPLEWKNVRVSYGPETYEAKTPVGFYQVFVDEDSAAGSVFAEWAWDQSQFGMTGATTIGRYATFPAAEAAAQADYQARIEAALHPQSAAGEEGKL